MIEKKPINIYNSLTRKLEQFNPLKDKDVKMYVCGPTVYDEAHIGHARGAFIFDVIRNYFIYKSYNVTFVRNVTDVDDKIIDKARKIARPSEDLKNVVREVAEKYLASYNRDLDSLGIGKPDMEPKATEHIDQMLRFIRRLIENGYAYKAGGDVYFRVKKFKEYGKLSHQSVEKMASGVRISPNEQKEDPLDFALWKKSKEDEPVWKDGDIEGRPGWHIECSAMSTEKLGETFDIHGGGIDLIFPHHENEVAQSEAYSGKPFAKYWMHNGLLTIKGEKMAKSLGNYLSISDFLKKYKDADILKLFFLSTHYRSPIDFSEENMLSAKAAKERFTIFFDKSQELIDKYPSTSSGIDEFKKEKLKLLQGLTDEFEKGMDDDFNTAYALGALFSKGVTSGYYVINENKKWTEEEKAEFLRGLLSEIKRLGRILNLSFKKPTVSDDLKERIEKDLKLREEARRNKDFNTADTIRDGLFALGVVIEDTARGTKWRIK